MITITRATVPPLDEYLTLLRQIFEARHFTNHGAMVARFEAKVLSIVSEGNPASDIQVVACSSGTLALEAALRALRLEGKSVVVTPFTYVATLSAILSVGGTPVFADIDPHTLCLTPESVEAVLDEQVAACLPVHVYGNACDVEGFSALSRRYGITVLYDAAHSFGASYEGKSVLSYGDAAVGSFHATKVIHTCEGGCVVCHSNEVLTRLGLVRALGHAGDNHVMPGINAKMSELHAAMGLCLLPTLAKGIAARKALAELYDTLLDALPVQRPVWRTGLQRNYAYYPVLFADESTTLAVQAALTAQDIIPRRYFFPALNTLPYLQKAWRRSCPVAESASRRVLCLPLYADLPPEQVRHIAHILRSTLS